LGGGKLLAPRFLAALVATLLVGIVSGAAGVLVHQAWWGLALGLAAALATLAWLPAGALRLAFALGWMVSVGRATLTLPAGDFLIAANAAGWSFLAGSLVLLVAALATIGSRSGRAEDHGKPGPPT